jgi:hypothetical protein
MDKEIATSWYRQPWAWFAFLIPAATIVAGIYTLLIATRNADTLVVDDYYKEGLAINQVINKQQKARALEITASLSFDADGLVRVKLNSVNNHQINELELHLIHATLANQDQTVPLAIGTNATFVGKVTPISQGKWIVNLEPSSRDWRLSGNFYFPTDRRIELR